MVDGGGSGFVGVGVSNVRRPAERLLVVSDNVELCAFLKSELDQILFDHPLKVDFRYTSPNSSPKGMIDFGAQKINLKDEGVVNEIIKNYDLVFSLHCKQIFPSRLVENVCCVNFHPGLNPYNRGWYPQVFSIINKLPAGATIHLMDAEVDHGEIIAQEEVDVRVSDTSLEVYERVIRVEKKLIHENLFNLIEGSFGVFEPAGEGNYNGINDYSELCALDLESVGTLGEHLDLLRATTHGSFKNAYFFDGEGRKYFVRIIIDEVY